MSTNAVFVLVLGTVLGAQVLVHCTWYEYYSKNNWRYKMIFAYAFC
jgi:hypothetical protein